MPVYNTYVEFLQEAIDSVLNQTHKDLELLIGDDGSEVPTLSECQHLDDPRIKVFQLKHQGVSATRNFLLDRAQGDYIVFLDADDVLHCRYMEKKLDYIRQHPEISIVFDKLSRKPFKNCKVEVCGDILSHITISNLIWHYSSQINYIKFLAPIKVVNQYNIRFNPLYSCWEDLDFLLQLSQHAQMIYLPEMLYFYRPHDEKNKMFRPPGAGKDWTRIIPLRMCEVASIKDDLDLSISLAKIIDGKALVAKDVPNISRLLSTWLALPDNVLPCEREHSRNYWREKLLKYIQLQAKIPYTRFLCQDNVLLKTLQIDKYVLYKYFCDGQQ